MVNEPPYDVAPRFFLGSTKDGRVTRYHETLSDTVVGVLEEIVTKESSVNLADVVAALNRDRPVQDIWFGPAFVFPDVRGMQTKAIEITPETKDILKPHFPYTHDELDLKQPCFAILENGMAVSVCCSARQTSLAAEASVYTLEAFRGRGYGVEVVSAWASAVQQQGRHALYSTSWDNHASQTIAKKLHLIQYGTDFHIS